MEVEISSEYTVAYWEWSKSASWRFWAAISQWWNFYLPCTWNCGSLGQWWCVHHASSLGDGQIVNNGVQRHPGLAVRLHIVIYIWLGVPGSKIIKRLQSGTPFCRTPPISSSRAVNYLHIALIGKPYSPTTDLRCETLRENSRFLPWIDTGTCDRWCFPLFRCDMVTFRSFIDGKASETTYTLQDTEGPTYDPQKCWVLRLLPYDVPRQPLTATLFLI